MLSLFQTPRVALSLPLDRSTYEKIGEDGAVFSGENWFLYLVSKSYSSASTDRAWRDEVLTQYVAELLGEEVKCDGTAFFSKDDYKIVQETADLPSCSVNGLNSDRKYYLHLRCISSVEGERFWIHTARLGYCAPYDERCFALGLALDNSFKTR